METLGELTARLIGADEATVQRLAMEKGSLPVRLAMLGIAAARKGESPLWWGYPPGVFLGYKWDGPRMRALTQAMAEHIRALGYRVFLDTENLDENADAYFRIPQYIASLQECSFYVLLLTEACADFITARKRKTTWIFDEYQHAVGLANSGRMFIVPVLLEPGGATDAFDATNSIDMTREPRELTRLDAILTPAPLALDAAQTAELHDVVATFDRLFLASRWDESARVLDRSAQFAETFDHRFRRMLHAIYTANAPALEAAEDALVRVYGRNLVGHIYRGYCAAHGIPDRTRR